MHEGAVCREIMNIVEDSAKANGIARVHEIVLAVGPWAGINEMQLNFYFDILRRDTLLVAESIACILAPFSLATLSTRPP